MSGHSPSQPAPAGARPPAQRSAARPALLCVSQSFPPERTPTAIRAGKLLAELSAQWEVTVVSEARGPSRRGHVRVETVPSRRPSRLLRALRRMRLSKLLEMLVWPDESIFWVLPAILAGRRLVRELSPSAIVVFMMPYSSGLAGIALSRITGLPLILNLDDSPTCTDMHPHSPTRLHFRMARALENLYARSADAVVYVSQANLDAVSSRQPEHVRRKLHLVRYGADHTEFRSQPPREGDFEIVYVGVMSGWWALIEQHERQSTLKRIYGAWTRLGRYERTVLDQRTSSPAVIGRAIVAAIESHPSWTGRVKLTVYDSVYPSSVTTPALQAAGVQEVVRMGEPVPHEQVAGILCRADLLLLTLPGRPDGSRGGRISAKTYEYLMTDRPILAAVPPGENRDYLSGKPGVWVVDPDDRRRMTEIVAELAQAKFAGAPRTFDRGELQREISYAARAAQFAAAVGAAMEHGSERRSGAAELR